jgi:hypothetical protein
MHPAAMEGSMSAETDNRCAVGLSASADIKDIAAEFIRRGATA